MKFSGQDVKENHDRTRSSKLSKMFNVIDCSYRTGLKYIVLYPGTLLRYVGIPISVQTLTTKYDLKF